MEGHLPPLLELLLLRGPVVVPEGDALGQDLPDSAARIELRQAVVGVRDETLPKGTQSDLGHGPVEQELRGDVHVVHSVLQVGHQEQVPRGVEVVVDGLVVDVAQHGAGLGPLVGVLVDEVHEVLHERVRVLLHREVGGQRHRHDLLLLELDSRRGLGLRLRSRLRGRGLLLLDLRQGPHGLVHGLRLEIQVLDLPQRDPGHHGVLRGLGKVVGHLLSDSEDDQLVLEPVDVVLGVRVDDLERLEPLIVQPL
mmetsp:Transcript_9105/g.32761  ORF Transcript_9105/g.32761 Transcript_9105/m.32761 type:complete len:252 (-) Transcript_9105:1202-1957(-)